MLTDVAAPPRLKVSPNNRFMVDESGEPFFWMGDTAWALFQKLNREDVDAYMTGRAARGFTVAMAPALPLSGYTVMPNGLTTPNRYGHLPLIDKDPTRPNEKWFDHVEYVVDAAARAGIYFGLLPTWAEYVTGDDWDPRNGPIIFDEDNARTYGAYLGTRLKDKTNVIWILGGDRNPPGTEHVWRAMAEGIAHGSTGASPRWDEDHPAWRQLVMTYHATGGYPSSSETFHDDAWLSTNLIQTWAHEENIIPRVRHDYELTPPKPTFLGEPSYEGNVAHEGPNNSKPWRVRYQAYWSLFSGAHGHTYGNHSIWMFADDWREALAAPGGDDMRHVRSLLASRPMLTRVPDYEMITSPVGEGREIRLATRGADGAYAFVYLTSGGTVTVDLSTISGEAIDACWYDPREGTATPIDSFSTEGTQEFAAPTSGEDNDWVLVLDDASRGFPPPKPVD